MAERTTPAGPTTPRKGNKSLDTEFARSSSLTEEQFSFVIHHVAQGASSEDVLALLNNTFSLKEDIFTVKETILYIRCNVQRERLLLKRASKYAWYTTPQPLASSTPAGNDEGLGRGRKFTDEMRAFMIWKHELGYPKLSILTSLNNQFGTKLDISYLKGTLTSITKDEKTADHLVQSATSYGWWTQPPGPGTPDGMRAARHARVTAARKRHTARAQEQKQRMNEIGKFESELLGSPDASAGKGKLRAATTAADGTLDKPVKMLDRPVKMEDFDDEGEEALAYFNKIDDGLTQSRLDQLSPTRLRRAPPRSPRPEVNDGEDVSKDSDEDGGATLSEYSSEDVPE